MSSPYQPPSEYSGAAGSPMQPAPTGPKVLGYLNIIFGVLLMLCGLWQGLQYIAQPMIGSMFEAQEGQLTAEAERRVDDLKARKEAAKTDAEKQRIQQQIETAEAAKEMAEKLPDLMPFSDKRIMTWGIIDMTTGLLLNLAMLVSGIGLIMFRSWGRTLALWVAGIKILRLIVSQTYFALVCVPLISEGMMKLLETVTKLAPAGGGPQPQLPLQEMGTMYGVMFTAMAICMVVFGSIYPIVLLCMLNTRRTKAAFNPPPPDQF